MVQVVTSEKSSFARDIMRTKLRVSRFRRGGHDLDHLVLFRSTAGQEVDARVYTWMT